MGETVLTLSLILF